jgi:hypothetical protein
VPGRIVVALGLVALVAPVAAAFALRPGLPGAGESADTTPAEAPAAHAPAHSAFPTPPSGAVVYSRELRANVLALGVVPARGHVLVQASIVDAAGHGRSGLAVSFHVDATAARGIPCGPGCYRATVAEARPAAVEVRTLGTRWRVALPRAWPPSSAAALVARAGRVWRGLRSLVYHERLASGPRRAAISTWRIQAPDRVAYVVQGGWSGIIVGTRRWDRSPGGGRWIASAQTRVTQPAPFWVSASSAHVLGTTVVRGRPAWHVSFFDPGTPAWFDVLLDKATLRTLELRMNTTAHFMHDVYRSFDRAAPITPPAAG